LYYSTSSLTHTLFCTWNASILPCTFCHHCSARMSCLKGFLSPSANDVNKLILHFNRVLCFSFTELLIHAVQQLIL
jgi:hypothetical protein